MKPPIIKLLTLIFASILLSGCFGGTIAQQIARSILMHGADKATEAAIDTHDRNERIAAQNISLKNTELDKYQIAQKTVVLKRETGLESLAEWVILSCVLKLRDVCKWELSTRHSIIQSQVLT